MRMVLKARKRRSSAAGEGVEAFTAWPSRPSVAAEAGVRMLSLVHISARYHVGAVLDEARAVLPESNAPRDFDLVRIPFPEKGPPELIREGSIRSGEQEDG